MKRLLLIIISILFFTTILFPQSKINKNNLVQYGDKWFKENDDKPYTGRVFDLYKSIGVFPKNTNKFMERRLKIGAGSGTSSSLFTDRALKLRTGQKLTTSVNKGSKLLNIGKKVFSKTPIGRAVNLAVNVGSGIGLGYSYAKNKFSKKKADFQKGDYSDIKTDKKMSGGMMQGYGAARTSGMGLEDQSLPPGKMVRASKGKMLTAKQKKLDKNNNGRIDGEDFKLMEAKYGKHMKK